MDKTRGSCPIENFEIVNKNTDEKQFSVVPKEIIGHIFSSYFDLESLLKYRLLNKEICHFIDKDPNKVIENKVKSRCQDIYNKCFFGVEKWKTLGIELPEKEKKEAGFESIPTTFFKSISKIKEDDIYFYSPKKVILFNQEMDVTMGLFLQVTEQLSGYTNYVPSNILDQFGNKPNKQSGWVALAKNVIEESKNKNYEEQKKMLYKEKGEEVPTALNVILGLAIQDIKKRSNDLSLSGNEEIIYTRCQESINDKHLAVGGNNSGLNVIISDEQDKSVGLAPLRKIV